MMTLVSRNCVHALTVLVFLNRWPPFVIDGEDRLWFDAIDAGLTVC